MRIDAGQGQFGPDPGRIGIGYLPQKKFGADRDHFAAHVLIPFFVLCRTRQFNGSARRLPTG